MSIYSGISKIVLTVVSSLNVLNTIFLIKDDTWCLDLFYYLPLFSLVIVIDFLFYELYSPSFQGKNHLIFCTFPLSRWDVLLLELKYYLRRWEIKIFLGSIWFYLAYLYYLNNSTISPLILLLVLYTLQFLFFVLLLFISKNFLRNEDLNTNLRNMVSILITIFIVLYTLASHIELFNTILLINPLSSAFLSYLLGIDYGIIAYTLTLILTVILAFVMKRKFKKWPQYQQ